MYKRQFLYCFIYGVLRGLGINEASNMKVNTAIFTVCSHEDKAEEVATAFGRARFVNVLQIFTYHYSGYRVDFK